MATNELAKIEKQIDSLIEVGAAPWRKIAELLDVIRNNGLWVPDYKSFKQYVNTRWGKTDSWAHNLIKSHVATKQLTKNGQAKDFPVESPRAARELAKVPEMKRAEVVKVATTSGRPVTATAIKAASVAVNGEFDELGWPIPPDAMPAWNRRQEVQDILTQLSRIKSRLEKAYSEGDALYMSEMTDAGYQDTIANIDKVYTKFSRAKPYAVCLMCQGRCDTVKCAECDGRGVISERYWNHNQHETVKANKAMRLSQIAKLKEAK